MRLKFDMLLSYHVFSPCVFHSTCWCHYHFTHLWWAYLANIHLKLPGNYSKFRSYQNWSTCVSLQFITIPNWLLIQETMHSLSHYFSTQSFCAVKFAWMWSVVIVCVANHHSFGLVKSMLDRISPWFWLIIKIDQECLFVYVHNTESSDSPSNWYHRCWPMNWHMIYDFVPCVPFTMQIPKKCSEQQSSVRL